MRVKNRVLDDKNTGVVYETLVDTVSMYVYIGETRRTLKKQTAENKPSIITYDYNNGIMNIVHEYDHHAHTLGLRPRLWLPSSTIGRGGYRRHSAFGPKLASFPDPKRRRRRTRSFLLLL